MTNAFESFDALLRSDPLAFLSKSFATASGGDQLVRNWHHEAFVHHLDKVRLGDDTRLIITVPPRYLKSITASVVWVAWMLGHDPTKKFVCISYSADLAQKHARDCRALMQKEWYQRIFPNTRLAHRGSAEMDFRTTAGGGRLSTSIGGTLTGRGGDIIIIDDPIKPDEANSETARRKVLDWYSNTLVSRLNDKNKGAIILVMQRLHEEDLAGHLLETGEWTHLSLPAIADEDMMIEVGSDRYHLYRSKEVLQPEREGLSKLVEIKKLMGSANFSAQYLQAPVPAEGLHVKRDWFKYYDTKPETLPEDQIIQSWDTASKDGVFNDYSVCVTALVRKRDVYILDVVRDKLKFPDLRRKVINHGEAWEVDVLLIEDAASGAQLIQLLRDDRPARFPRPIACTPDADKVTRFAAQTPRIEAGEVFFPKDAPWLAEFQRELLGFPNLKHDDQVDALVQLLKWREPKRSGPGAPPMLFLEGENGYMYQVHPRASGYYDL